MKPPNNFEEKLEEILKEYAPRAEESYHITGREPFYAVKESDIPNVVKAISTLCEEEVKRARISELKGLKMYDCFNEDYTNDPRPSKLVSIRLAELEKGK